jgi:hypothetical protein
VRRGAGGAGGTALAALAARAALIVLATASATPSAARAQRAAATATPSAPPGASLHVSLLTIGYGSEIWELFGHNAIRIRDDAAGTDIAYNWGVFDFRESGFLLRFAQGSMRYSTEGYNTNDILAAYRANNRSIWEQDLTLSPLQAVALQTFIAINTRPENKFYNYDYFRDNCSTRVRDMLDRVLGGAIHSQTDTAGTGTTYRWHAQRLTQGDKLTYTGIMLGLAQPTDRPISAWEEMFLPVRMMASLRRVTVTGIDGRVVPLVSAERQLFAASRPVEATTVGRFTLYYLAAGVLFGGLLLVLARAARRGRNSARRWLSILARTWGVVAGLAGVGLLLLWTATNHYMTKRNENVLQLEPLSLALLVTVPMLLRGARRNGRAWSARTIAFAARIPWVIAGIAVLGFVLQVVPGFVQVNGDVIGLVLPVHVSLAVALGRARHGAPNATARSHRLKTW